MDKILWDFEIQMDHLIPVRTPNLVLINKKRERERENLLFSEFCCSRGPKSENKESEKN